MGDTRLTEEQMKKQETGIARTEITLAALRDEAIKSLLKEGKSPVFTSNASKDGDVLKVDTKNDKTGVVTKMVVDGTATGSRGILSTELVGNFTITHGSGQNARIERDEFRLKGGHWDEIMGRPDLFNVGFTRKDATGKPIQVYEPALSEVVISGGRVVEDPNGQPLRRARPAGSDNNAGAENIANRGNRRLEANYIIHDPTIGDLSYNQTKEKTASGFAYRSVLRDLQGTVLGIVEQNVSLDENFDVTAVRTSARKPMQVKK